MAPTIESILSASLSVLRQSTNSSTSTSDSNAAKIVDALSFIDDIVSFVWIGLTLLMILSLVLIIRVPATTQNRVRRIVAIVAIIVLIAATWTYPLYSGGFDDTDLVRALYSNYAYIAVYVIVVFLVILFSFITSLPLFPTAIWITLATIYVIAKIRYNDDDDNDNE